MESEESRPRWRLGPSPGVAGTRNLIRCADFALERFENASIPVPRGSRLPRARALIAEAQEQGASFSKTALLAEATRAAFEFYWISRALGPAGRQLPNELSKALADALGGPDLPADETDGSLRARSVQFELFVGAWLTAGGVVVSIAEPDLLMAYGDSWVGLAAKRIRSRTKLKRQVRAAAHQIRRAGVQGHVVLNVDALIDQMEHAKDPEEAGRQFNEKVPELTEAIDWAYAQPHVCGLLALGTSVRWRPVGSAFMLDISMFTRWRMFPSSGDEKILADEFIAEFEATQQMRMQNF